MHRHVRCIAMLVLGSSLLAAHGQNVVFRPGDLGSLTYATPTDGTIYADDVRLTGSRLAGAVKIPVLAPFVGSVTSDITAYLYAGDDYGGLPGTLLWSSNRAAQTFTGVSTTTFNNINVFVPAQFYWGVRFGNIQKGPAEQFGPLFASSSNAVPTNSTGRRYLYTGTGSVFDALSYGGVDSTFAVTVEEGITNNMPVLDIGRSVRISFLGQSGTNYLGQYTTDLLSGSWIDVEPAKTGTGSVIHFHDTATDSNGRAYRVLAD